MKKCFLIWIVAVWLSACATAGTVIKPDRTVLSLDELGLYNVGYQFRGADETNLPVGWSGNMDSPTGMACLDAGAQNGRNAWLMHCPWKGKTGVTFQTFTVALPQVPKITLLGSTALKKDAVGKSDGVTYRIFVNGEKRFETNRTDSEWQPFSVDLTPSAGKNVTIRFEVDPGPHDNSSFDFSLWADRRLEMPGFTPTAARRPNPLPLNLAALSSRQTGGVVPPSGFEGKTSVQVDSAQAVLRYDGADGVLRYRWCPKADSLLGEVSLVAEMTGDTPVEISPAAQARLDWTANSVPGSSRLSVETTADGETQVVLTKTYSLGDRTATVIVKAALRGKSLVFDLTCDQPVISNLDGGGWGPALRRRAVNIPYYSWPILYLSEENLFAGAFLDWTASQASYQSGARAVYTPRTDGTRNLLHERLIYTASWHLDETLPNVPNAPSPYREDLSHRVVMDIWGGSFESIQTRLHALAGNGFGPGMAIIHDWQFGGYDNKLPRHVPANADLGGDPAMKALVETAQRDDIRMALHENYADYYPNTPDFSESDIALESNGSRVLAWFHPGTKIQSFGVRPTSVLSLAKAQGPEVLRRYGSNACYLDVHSSVPPWFHQDYAVDQPNAGQFRAVQDAHRALWSYERELHGGPVLGEGNNHWYWSGELDGVEAQFGQGWHGAGTDAPLLVDFDLLKIHPLQLNHGMGYYERWWEHGPDAKRSLLSLLDQYRMQEAAYGHEGFLGGEAWHDPGYAWLESHLLPPLTIRTALAGPVTIEYASKGDWLDASEAFKEGSSFSQVRVRYDNGLTVWSNGGDQPLQVDQTAIPPNGWLAQGAGLVAGTTTRAGITTDYAETPDSVFVNARNAADWQERGVSRIRPTVAQFIPGAPRTFRASYQWAVDEAVKDDLTCFVHFVSTTADPALESISFQQDHPLSPPSSQWKPGQPSADGPWDITVPQHAASGDYLWTIGLYPKTGGRLALRGVSDAHDRLILGTLHVVADGACSFTPTPVDESNADSVNRDARVLDFGTIHTNGSVFVRRQGSDWTLRPFPADRQFTVELSAARFGSPAEAKITGGWWQLPLTGEKEYRWPAPR